MLHVYGWRRDGGPYFLDNPRTLEDGIAFAETVLKDCRRGFLRAEVKDVRRRSSALDQRARAAARWCPMTAYRSRSS